MAKLTLPPTNFAQLQEHDDQLVRLGRLAERYFAEDPNTCLLKLRQFAELLAQLVAAKSGLRTVTDENQYDLLRRLQDQGIVPREVFQLFDQVRFVGNKAHHVWQDDQGKALSCLTLCWQLGVWFHRVFSDPNFKSGPFIPQKAAALSTLVAEIDTLDWDSAKEEGMGDLYKGLLEKNANEKKSGAGQYFTPRPLIDAMVAVMRPRLGDVIQDPAAHRAPTRAKRGAFDASRAPGLRSAATASTSRGSRTKAKRQKAAPLNPPR